jgi:hypothetical protein
LLRCTRIGGAQNIFGSFKTAEGRLALPDEKKLADEIAKTRKSLVQRKL